MDKKSFLTDLKNVITNFNIICLFIFFLGGAVVLAYQGYLEWKKSEPLSEVISFFNKDYDVSMLGDSPENELIRYGFELFKNTPDYIGFNADNRDKIYSGNGLACGNCHLGVGTKPFAGSLIGVISRFPQYRGRENKIGTIEERINGCMQRSLNGMSLPMESKELMALVSYLTWLNKEAPANGQVNGQGFAKITLPNRPINLYNGAAIYDLKCSVCHGNYGQGMKFTDTQRYQYPPLWGRDSYNNGAGMTRVITAAQFIKANMPFGATFEQPLLTDEEAYDVAGFINQHERPQKMHLDLDFPDRMKKPVSTPYPPYVDSFTIEQHQVGPFQPIIDFYKETYDVIKTK